MTKELVELERRLAEVDKTLNGDATLAYHEFETPTVISSRIRNIMNGLISTTSAPTTTFINSYNDASKQFAPVHAEVKAIAGEVSRIENLLEQSGAPYTPGRLPEWKGQ